MTAGIDLVNRAATFVGQRYSTAPGRDDPNSSHKDCSGLIAASYLAETGQNLGANVSVTIYDLCVRQGLWVSREDAKWIAGSCLLMPEDPYVGWGPAGHIGFSDGNGGTVEATPPRVQRLSFNYQSWGSNACLLPGIDYSNGGMGGGSTTQELPKEDDVRLIRNTDNNEWFLATSTGLTGGIPNDRAMSMMAQGFPANGLNGGEIWGLAVDLSKIHEGFINRMKELGVGGTTVVEKPVIVPADPTSLTDEALINELERRLG